MTDLFLKSKTKEQKLEEWCKNKKVFATHDIIKWGCDNFYNRSDRTKRNFIKQGLIRKLTDFEKFSWGYNCKDAVYCWKED